MLSCYFGRLLCLSSPPEEGGQRTRVVLQAEEEVDWSRNLGLLFVQYPLTRQVERCIIGTPPPLKSKGAEQKQTTKRA
jgi:hypothetical protein